MIDLSEKVKTIHHENERKFAVAFFDHEEWEYEPKFFELPYGERYLPDFLDAKRNVYIEVIGSRQAFSFNKLKYKMMRDTYPEIKLEFRIPSGEEVVPDEQMKIRKRTQRIFTIPEELASGEKPTFDQADKFLFAMLGSMNKIAAWLGMSQSGACSLFDRENNGQSTLRTREWVCFKVQEYIKTVGAA